MNPIVADALEYERLGLSVFPLKVKGKEPKHKGWNRGGPANALQIERWFGGDGGSLNVGLRTGNGIVAIDVDPRNGGDESLQDFLSGRELPETATALTGGGGKHYVYRTAVPVRCFQGFQGQRGIDVKGTGGYIVVEPSIHPDTGKDYVWIRHPRSCLADAPPWLLHELTTCRTVVPRRSVLPVIERLPLGQTRLGDNEILTADLIRRFPIPCYGRRDSLMLKAVGSLLGRGYDDRTTEAAVVSWWGYHYAIGKCRTPPTDAAEKVGEMIARTRANSCFGRAVSECDHRSLCRSVVLGEGAYRLMAGPVEAIEQRTEKIRLSERRKLWIANTEADPTQPPDGKEVTLTSRRLCDRLCQSPDETAFVEALAVHWLHARSLDRSETLKITHEQIREVVADRHSGLTWDNRQLERLKAKYVSRPKNAATRFELLREIVKGHRVSPRTPGVPSEYEPLGLLALLAD